MTNGEKETEYGTLSDGTPINPRNWDMYKDKILDEKGYIKDVRPSYKNELEYAPLKIQSIGINYWTADRYNGLIHFYPFGDWGYSWGDCLGVRPVVELNEGVYIASGTGVKGDPYILGKD